ncbi:integrin alpha FG-GAP repeat-containing protein 2 [Gamsiella multidivaricata]|nr:integrin alpha FG-GAP repeat-containing protein 2 [Gamsiella multidivaricata]
MPTARHVSLVQKLRWHVSGNISPTAFAIGDIDGHGDNAFVIGNLVGELFIFKGNHPEGLPWLTCKGLGTITAVAIGDIRNWGKNSIVVMSAEGLCHIFDVEGLDDESDHILPSAVSMSPAPGPRSGHIASFYSSIPHQGTYQGSITSQHGHGANPSYPSIPATPSIKPVPDIHHHHQPQHNHHASNHSHHGTPPLPPPSQNTPHGSASSSVSGFQHQTHTSNSTPIHSHPGSIHGGITGARRGSEIFPGSVATTRTAAVIANSIGTPPVSAHGPASASTQYQRSIGGNSASNSPTGTPLLKPQHPTLSTAAPGTSSKDHSSKRSQAGTARNSVVGRAHVRNIGGRRVLDGPNLTLPVPVNINRAYIADIDGDGLNEIVLARTDRIMHSYALQTTKATSPTTASQPNSQPLNLVKMLSRTSSISTLDSSGLLSPVDDRRETVIHYPSLASMGRQCYPGSTATMAGANAAQGNSDGQDNNGTCDPSTRLVLVEKKRWALDGQIHCLAVTKDTHTGMPILLVAQPGLKFVMVDHNGNISEPVTQIQRDPQAAVTTTGPDTPTRVTGSGDVATDIICGTHYVNGEEKDIIGLMSMDGAFALHDLESSTVKVHDLDSTHKIFGFSKLNFGNDYLERHNQDSIKARSGYGRSSDQYADENNYEDDDDEDAAESEDGGAAAETQTLIHNEFGEAEDGTRYGRRRKSRKSRRPASSMLISEPFGSRFQKNDMFVGCSWSGITFFIDQEFNTARYDFDARVCAFGAGQYAVTPGRNEPCLFYVDFEDNIFVYHNLYIQTEPSVPFEDIVKKEPTLIRASHQIRVKENGVDEESDAEDSSIAHGLTSVVQNSHEGASNNGFFNGRPSVVSSWSEREMKEFIHDSLYNVNRYENEYQHLRKLVDIERSKRAALQEAEANKERERQEAKDLASIQAVMAQAEADAAVMAAMNESNSAQGSPTYMDLRLSRPTHVLAVDSAGGTSGSNSRSESRSSLNRGKAGQRGQFVGHDITTVHGTTSSQYTQSQPNAANQDDDDSLHSPLSPASPVSLSFPKPPNEYTEKRRSSLLIKDVLSHYEGRTTPPLKSPTSPSASSNHMSKDYRGGASGSAGGSSTTLTNIMKRFSLKDIGNGSRLSRSSTASSGSGSSSGDSQSTITQGHPLLGAPVLTKVKSFETRPGKGLKVSRPAAVSRNRALGATGRKLGTRSRLSLQQDREDDTEEDDVEQAPSDDGTGETDIDNLLDFDRSSRKSVHEDDSQQGTENEGDIVPEDYVDRTGGNETNEREEDIVGVYTPSTISPIPSPGRLYGNQQGAVTEPSASLDSTAFMLAKGLLSPSSHSSPGGIMAATSAAGATGKSLKRQELDSSHDPSYSSSSRGHVRQRSGHGLLDAGSGHFQSREMTGLSGISSGPNSAGHNSVQSGRRSRAESILSTGSDIGGVVVPDITLLASSFPTQPMIPLSEPARVSAGDSEDSDDDVYSTAGDETDAKQEELIDGQERSTTVLSSGVRRPSRRSATLGSQDGAHGAGSGSDTATGRPSDQRTNRAGAQGTNSAAKGADVKLLPAPLPRSNQHYQRQQLEQHGSAGGLAGAQGSKDGAPLAPGHVSFSSSKRPNSAGGPSGGGGDAVDSLHGGGEGFVRGRNGKSSSTTSSATVSDFGSGPSSPLATNLTNVTVANAILFNPSTNSYKGFSVLSLPVTSPSVSTASGQQHQYFSSSHYHPQPPPLPHTGSSLYSFKSTHPHDRASIHEDDRMSILSRTSTYHGADENNDVSSILAPTGSSAGIEHGIYGMSPASTSTGHLVSDSLVRRLEELQQHDRDLEEKQRQREREKEKERDREKGKDKARDREPPRTSQISRPSPLSRVNSGASIQSTMSHHRMASHPPSHGSTAGSMYGSGSGSASASGPTSSSGAGSGPASGSGRHGWEDDHHESAKRLKNRLGLGQGL